MVGRIDSPVTYRMVGIKKLLIGRKLKTTDRLKTENYRPVELIDRKLPTGSYWSDFIFNIECKPRANAENRRFSDPVQAMQFLHSDVGVAYTVTRM